MKKRISTVAICLAIIAGTIYAATGTVTQSNDKVMDGSGAVSVQTITWTSTAGGAASDTITLNGYLLQVEYIPGTSSSQPTDLYDITLTDSGSFDVLAGTGANLSQSTASRRSPSVIATDGTNNAPFPVLLSGDHTLSVSNAGNTKSGTIKLWLKK